MQFQSLVILLMIPPKERNLFPFCHKIISTFRNVQASFVISSKCIFQKIKNTDILCWIKKYSILIKNETLQKWGFWKIEKSKVDFFYVFSVPIICINIEQTKVVIPWSRLAGMKFCPVLAGSRQRYKLFINYILWFHVKRFIPERRDPSFT